MRGLYDSIRSIEHIARWKKKLLTAKGEREFKARMETVITSIEEQGHKGCQRTHGKQCADGQAGRWLA